MNIHETSLQLMAVREWMQTFGQATPKSPCIPNREVCKLRFMLIMEELMELANAMGIRLDFDWSQIAFEDSWRDPVAALDALTDLEVVVKGCNVACGMLKDRLAFNEVMRSNHSKFWTKDEVDRVESYSLGNALVIVESPTTPGKFIVKNTHGKVIKSPSYSKPHLTNFI